MRRSSIAAVLGAIALWAAPARADAIDGAWCRDDGSRLMINGPSITTPSGARTRGDYSRHYFTYVVPAGDPGAGNTIEMRLLGEYDMQSRPAGAASYDAWKRCGPAVS